MNFSEFLAKQNRIYEEFRDTSKIQLEGISPKIFENQGGYIIAYRHSENIVSSISEFSQKVSKIVTSIKYGKDNIHTTLATYQVSDEFQLDKFILDNLSKSVKDNLPLIKAVKIDYTEWLIDQTTGIVGGNPNRGFFENAERIVQCARQSGMELKLPWGAHITVSRFLETTSEEQTLELLSLFKNSKSLGISKPTYIDVAYFTTTPKEFRLNVHERFKL